ncbi:MAG: hypothetical protein HKN61_06440 [Flavobacteriaceae bacterium]|nr:hypothetical protein [Flavobacteriaceae bacterium]
MESDKIKKLINSYFEAETSVAEEKEIREYFRSGEVAPELLKYGPMFDYFAQAKEETYTGSMPRKSGNRKKIYSWLSVAAVIGIGLGLFLENRYSAQQEEQEHAEYAYQETRKALQLLTSNLDRGTEKVAYLHEFEIATEKIYNNP